MSPKPVRGEQEVIPPPAPHRALVKGPLKPPATKNSGSLKSYTVTPATSGEVTIRKQADRKRPSEPVEISSTAVPQPFVDPGVLERRGRSS
ncbi:hypothetical protein MGN70_005929 [Eutypa lata]|nr:hypothetical protein MGN70_005929 [Eutypa lata]